MNSAELKTALETIVANFPIPTRFSRNGELVEIRNKFASVHQFSDGDVNVTVEIDATTDVKAAQEILVEIRARLASVDTGFKYTKKLRRGGHWNMGVFVTDELSRRFIPA